MNLQAGMPNPLARNPAAALAPLAAAGSYQPNERT